MEFELLTPEAIDRLAFAILALASWFTLHIARQEAERTSQEGI